MRGDAARSAASRLRRERRLQEITQADMAEAIGVSLTIYNRIEKHPERRALTSEEIERAAEFLGVPESVIAGAFARTAA